MKAHQKLDSSWTGHMCAHGSYPSAKRQFFCSWNNGRSFSILSLQNIAGRVCSVEPHYRLWSMFPCIWWAPEEGYIAKSVHCRKYGVWQLMSCAGDTSLLQLEFRSARVHNLTDDTVVLYQDDACSVLPHAYQMSSIFIFTTIPALLIFVMQ